MTFGIQNMEDALNDVPPADAPPTDAPPTDAPPTDVPPTDAPPTDVPPADNEIDEDKVRSYFKTKYGKEVTDFEELFQEKTKEVNPYDGISPELKAILDYNKETGRGLTDYQKLQRNIDEIPVLELAIEKAKTEIGMDVTDEELIEVLEEELNIDLSSGEELTTREKIKLNKFVKEYKEGLIADQEKYKTPLDKEKPADEVEMITLDNGKKVEKTVFEAHQKQRQSYIEDMKVAVDSVAKTSLSIEFDNNGTKENYSFDYDYDQSDKKSMLELTEDIDQTAAKLFRTEKGFDHQGFAKSIWRLDPKNWEKEVSAIVNKAIADNTERIIQNENNVNFNRNRIPNSGANIKRDIFQKPSGFGVKFDM